LPIHTPAAAATYGGCRGAVAAAAPAAAEAAEITYGRVRVTTATRGSCYSQPTKLTTFL